MPCLLLVDDEPDIIVSILRHTFRGQPLDLHVARTAAEGLALAASVAPDVILLDIGLPDMNGLDVYRQLKALDARRLVIFITGSNTADTAIEAMKLGAYDYLFKPVDAAQLHQVVGRALEISRLAQVPAVLAGDTEPDDRGDAIIGRCAAMREVYKAIGRVASQDVTVLITGESGTGKELVARAIYQHSKRANGPFLAINCAAIPETLLESELFGHEKGAFTGADRRRIGKFEQCNSGTLFLDEIGDMPLLTQTKVLRVLQDQAFQRLGSSDTVQTDVRLLAATNQDLEKPRRSGTLSARPVLSPARLQPPPAATPRARRRRGTARQTLSPSLQPRTGQGSDKVLSRVDGTDPRLFLAGQRAGAARALKSALLQTTGGVLLPDFLPDTLQPPPATSPAPSDDALVSRRFVAERLSAGTNDLYEEALRQMERGMFGQVLEHTGGNQLQAARILGISRSRLRKRLRELGITITSVVEGDEADEE